MKIYRISFSDDVDSNESSGFGFCTSLREAKQLVSGTNDTIDTLDVTISKQGILDVLSKWAQHPDNG